MALIADEGESTWLYLTAPGTQRIERDCWLFNTPTSPSSPDLALYAAQRRPPPAPRTLIDPGGVRATPSAERWSVRWSADGEAVAVAVDGEPIGFVRASDHRGFARFLREASAWGNPWDNDAASCI
jgi:hypothetical protein